MCAGVKEQNPDKGLMTQERTAQWENDKEFIGRIESHHYLQLVKCQAFL